MNRSISLIVVTALLFGCKHTEPQPPLVPAGHQPGERAAVLDAMDRYMTAISESDYATQNAMQMPEGMTYHSRPTKDGGLRVVESPNSTWSDPTQEQSHVLREQYWSPTVLIRGALAVVWAPYEFWVDGETSHCGVNIIDFVKVDGEWLVSNCVWTVEPGACDELRPADVSILRPL